MAHWLYLGGTVVAAIGFLLVFSPRTGSDRAE
jgi:hypothetical protein